MVMPAMAMSSLPDTSEGTSASKSMGSMVMVTPRSLAISLMMSTSMPSTSPLSPTYSKGANSGLVPARSTVSPSAKHTEHMSSRAAASITLTNFFMINLSFYVLRSCVYIIRPNSAVFKP